MNPGEPTGAAAGGATFRAVLRGAEFVLGWLERFSIGIAGIAFVAIAIVTGIDVIARYVLNAPMIWAYQLISDYLMVAIFFLAMASTQRLQQNIGVEILVRRLPDRPRAALALISLLLMAIFVGLMGWTGFEVFADAYRRQSVAAGLIPWIRWPSLVLVPVGAGLLLLRIVVDGLNNLAAAGGALDLATHRRHAPAGEIGGE